MLDKHAPHAFTHARPWDKFQGKQVGRKEVNIRTVFRPGHKKNPVLDTDNDALPTSATYGAHTGVTRASGVAASRRNFGAHANTDALGPVDLVAEQENGLTATTAWERLSGAEERREGQDVGGSPARFASVEPE